MTAFRSGRDFAARVGLTPRQNSTRGKTRLGRTSMRGRRAIRRLPIIGAAAVVTWAARKGPWLARIMARKPRMVVIVALANSEPANAISPREKANARIVWALTIRQDIYRNPVAA